MFKLNLYLTLKKHRRNIKGMLMNIKKNNPTSSIVVTYSQFDSNIRVFYVFLGFKKNT
jgi:hypothetical protein